MQIPDPRNWEALWAVLVSCEGVRQQQLADATETGCYFRTTVRHTRGWLSQEISFKIPQEEVSETLPQGLTRHHFFVRSLSPKA